MRFGFGVKLDLSMDLLGFYRIDILETMKKCEIMLGKHWDLVWCVMW